MGEADCKLRQSAPQLAVLRARRLPHVLEDFVGMERQPLVEQSLRFLNRLLDGAPLPFGRARHPDGAARQRPPEFVARPVAAWPAELITIARPAIRRLRVIGGPHAPIMRCAGRQATVSASQSRLLFAGGPVDGE